MRTFEAIPELIGRSGVPIVFGLCGDSNVEWVAAGVSAGHFRFVGTRHETGAVAAAVAYARATGHVGIATTTMGPGFAQTVNPMAAAVYDHIPLLLIAGTSPGVKANQRINQKEIVAALGAGFHNVMRLDELEASFWAAMSAADWNGTPQVLTTNDAILGDEVELAASTPDWRVGPESPDPASVSAAVDVLETAQNPLIIAGWGATRADCHAELVELADLVGARTASTMNANRFFSGRPNYLGVCGLSAAPLVVEEVAKSDVVLGVGATLNRYTIGDGGSMVPHATIIQCEVDIDRDFRASSAELGLLGDAKESVVALLAEWKRRGHRRRDVQASMPAHEQVQQSVKDIPLGHDPARGLDIRDVFITLNRALPANRVVVSDAGRNVYPLTAMMDAQDARSWLPSRGYGSVGLGMGAAVGAAAAAPDRPVVLFCGDGGFMMAQQELDTFRLHGLSVTIVVLNDEQYGAEITALNRHGLPTDVARMTMPDTPTLARAFGGAGVVVDSLAQLEKLDIPPKGIFLVEVRCDPEVNGRAI